MQELIKKAKDGDAIAVEQIIDKYTPLAINQASKYHIPSYEFEDLVQHCYLSIIKAIKLYEVETNSFSSFVARVVKNSMKDLLKCRIRHNREVPSSEYLENNVDEYLFTIEDQIIAYERLESVERALKKLPLENRKILIDFYIRRKKLKTIAEEMRVSYKKAFLLKKDAINKLKKLL